MTQQEISTEQYFINGFRLRAVDYKEIFRKVEIGMLLIKPDTGQIIDANQFLLNILSYTIADMFLKTIKEVRAFKELEQLSLSTFDSKLEEIETVIWNKKGDPVHVGLLKSYVEDEHLVVLQFNIQSVLGKKQSTNILQQKYEELEKQLLILNSELAATKEALRFERGERQKLSQNLHDSINQSLFSATLIAEVLPRLWEKDQALARSSLEDLHRLTLGASAELRILLAESRPSVLKETDFGHLLRLLGNVLSGRINIPVNIQAFGQNSTAPDMKVAIYYLCKDHIYNLARQIKAGKLEIQLLDEERTGILRIIIYSGENGNIKLNSSSKRTIEMLTKQANSEGVDVDLISENKNQEIIMRWKNPI
jgi:signal transduction histidine kinase